MGKSLTPLHYLLEILDLNRFRIGDKVRINYPDWERTEGVIIGIELRREHGQFKPDITILHDGDQISDGFEPAHLFVTEAGRRALEDSNAK